MKSKFPLTGEKWVLNNLSPDGLPMNSTVRKLTARHDVLVLLAVKTQQLKTNFELECSYEIRSNYKIASSYNIAIS